DWLKKAMPQGGQIGFDPWLHTRKEIRDLTAGLTGTGIGLTPVSTNPVDAIRGPVAMPPPASVRPHPVRFSGATATERAALIAADLQKADQAATVLTLADSVAWITNLRGADLPRNPVL